MEQKKPINIKKIKTVLGIIGLENIEVSEEKEKVWIEDLTTGERYFFDDSDEHWSKTEKTFCVVQLNGPTGSYNTYHVQFEDQECSAGRLTWENSAKEYTNKVHTVYVDEDVRHSICLTVLPSKGRKDPMASCYMKWNPSDQKDSLSYEERSAMGLILCDENLSKEETARTIESMFEKEFIKEMSLKKTRAVTKEMNEAKQEMIGDKDDNVIYVNFARRNEAREVSEEL